MEYANTCISLLVSHNNSACDGLKYTAKKKNVCIISHHEPLTRYVKLRVAHAPRMPGTFSPPPRVSNPDMRHGTCVTHVPWWMPGSLTSGFLWSRWRGKRSRHSRRMRNTQFDVTGKRPIGANTQDRKMSTQRDDDNIILAETPQGLQKSLDELHTYCTKWKLQVNTNKSMVIVFKRGRRRQNEHWSYGGTEMKCSHTATYFGLTLTPGGSFATTQRTLAEQASKAQFQLNRYSCQFKDIPPTIVYDLFVKMIFPVLNYAGEVRGFHSASDIEKVHLSFMKHLLGVKRSTQNVFVYGEFGTRPMKVLRKIQILKYWVKIVHGKKSLYVSNSYWVMYNDAINLPSKPNWATQVRDMLFHLGFGEAWYAQNVGDIAAFVYLFRQRVYDNYQQD